MTALPIGWGFRPCAETRRKRRPSPNVRAIADRILAVPHLAHGIKAGDVVKQWRVPYIIAYRAVKLARELAA